MKRAKHTQSKSLATSVVALSVQQLSSVATLLLLACAAGAVAVDDNKTALLFIIISGCTAFLNYVTRTHQVAQLSIRQASLLRVELNKLSRWTTQAISGLIIVLIIVALQADITLRDTVLFAVSIGAALIPAGLANTVRLISNRAPKKHLTHNIQKALRSTLATSFSQLWVVVLSIGAFATLHVAPALSIGQIIAVAFVMFAPILALGWDTPQHERHRDHTLDMRAVSELLNFGALAGLLTYAAYLFYFVRHHLGVRYIDPTLPMYQQATTAAFLTLILCLCAHLLLERADSHEAFFTDFLVSSQKLLKAFGLALFMTANVVYNPLLQPLFNSARIDFIDIVSALFIAGLYVSCRLLHRHTRKHTRHSVVQLHHEING